MWANRDHMDGNEVLQSLSILELAAIGNAKSTVSGRGNLRSIKEGSLSLIGNTSKKRNFIGLFQIGRNQRKTEK